MPFIPTKPDGTKPEGPPAASFGVNGPIPPANIPPPVPISGHNIPGQTPEIPTDIDSDESSDYDPDDQNYLVYINNLPPDISEPDLVSLVEDLDLNCQFDIVNFQPLSFMSPESPDTIQFINSLVEISNFQAAADLINHLNGYKWDENVLEVNFIPQFYPYNFMYPSNQALSQSPLTGHGFGMMPGQPGGYMPMPSPLFGHPSVQAPYKPAGPGVPGPNGRNYSRSFGYNSYNNRNRDPYMSLAGSILTPPISRYSSHSDSNSDLARMSGASGPNSNSPSHTNSFSSSATTASTASNQNPSGVPQFLMNFVNSNESKHSMPEFIVVKDDEGNPVKVNPCRLFVGNIPFSSTWANLKNFLVDKCAELEPGNDIEILRVEIPMHTNSGPSSTGTLNTNSRSNSRMGSVPFLPLDETSDSNSNETSPQTESLKLHEEPKPRSASHGFQKPLSRGFAIVTTGNKTSSDKLIKYFEGMEFEGRVLTVRYDKFPDYNNYVLQQLYPNQLNKEKALTSLAFERNSFQQKFYYGNSYPFNPFTRNGQHGQQNHYGNHGHQSHHFGHNHNNSYGHSFGHGFSLGNSSRSNSLTGSNNPHQRGHNRSYSHGTRQQSFHGPNHQSSPRFPILQPNFIPQIHPSIHYTNNLNVPRSEKRRLVSDKPTVEKVDEAEKARELVNSFKSLGISS